MGEDTFISEAGAAVLNLSGLWDGVTRIPRRWVGRVAKDKSSAAGKGSLHLVHGVDVARGIFGVIEAWEEDGEDSERCKGQRWMLTDGFVYDWWALMAGWADVDADGEKSDEPSEQARWVAELVKENGVRALPRSMTALGRCYDSREFWETFKLVPLKARVT